MRRWIYRPDNASGRARTSAFIVSWIIYSRSCTRSALSHSPPVSTSVITCTPVFVRGVLLETRSFQAECPRRPVSVTIYFPIMRILQPRGQASLHQPDTKGCKGSKWITDLLFHHWLSLQCTTFHPLSFPLSKTTDLFFSQTFRNKFSSHENYCTLSNNSVWGSDVLLTSSVSSETTVTFISPRQVWL